MSRTEYLMSSEIVEHVVTAFPVGVWRVDPAKSRVGFDVRHLWGLATVRGRFDEFRGTLVSEEHGLGGELSIDAASINTKNRRRDEHLRSAAFFDVERYPEIKFTTAAVTDRRKGLTISGDLRIGANQLRLQLPVTVEDRGDRVVLRSATAIARDHAGLAWNVAGMIGRRAKFAVELELVRVD
jgi:polyisoprenoid-binding protein YceI